MSERKVVLYIACSLDGYIATKDHNLDWLLTTEGEGDNGYSAFYETVDTILLGRVTYDWIVDHESGNFPYKGKECYVFSHTRQNQDEYVTFVDKDAVTFTQELKAKDGKDIWIVGGGKLLSVFMKEHLVNEIYLTVTPVILGEGIPLFYPMDEITNMKLLGIKQYNQFAELHYQITKE